MNRDDLIGKFANFPQIVEGLREAQARKAGAELAQQFGEWVGCLHPHMSRHKMTAMFKAYFDESSDQKQRTILVIGGWLGDVEAWKQVIPRWHQRVRRECLTSFHMADCEARRQEFAGWSIDRKNELVKDLIAILNDADLRAFGAGMLLKDFNNVLSANPSMGKSKWLREPYFILFGYCVQEICLWMNALPPADDVALVFDRHERLMRKGVEYFNDVRDESSVLYRERMRSIVFSSREKEIPLQAADLIAFELRKRVENLKDNP